MNVADIDRPLNEKGIQNSYLIAQRFAKRYPKPELIISSPACRALHTAIIFARVAGVSEKKIELSLPIYECSSMELLKIIALVPDSFNELMVFGHNSTFTEVSNMFLDNIIDNLPTSGITSLTFETNDWNIAYKTPIRTYVDYPKNDKFAV